MSINSRKLLLVYIKIENSNVDITIILAKETASKMLNQFIFKIHVQEEWIDYNKHMQDAYYGLAFSYAVDHFQDAVGFDENYRSRTGCTIFVVEDHKFYLNEVKLGSELVIKTTLLDTDKRNLFYNLRCL